MRPSVEAALSPMTTLITFLLLGLGNGAVFAALGVSIAISYRTSNVVNFGAASMAVFGGVIYATLRTQGGIYNPTHAALLFALIVLAFGVLATITRWKRKGIPSPFRVIATVVIMVGLLLLSQQPVVIHIGSNFGAAAALIVSVAICAAGGVVLYAAVFRRLVDAVPLIRVVASLGLLGLAAPLVINDNVLNGNDTINVGALFPAATWHWGRIVIQEQQLLLCAVIVAVVVVLTLLYRKTRFGLQTTTAAETITGATVLGISPNLVSGLNWAIGGAVAGLFGALIVTVSTLAPSDFSLFVVEGISAAMIGGMTSLAWTAVAGLGIGMLESYVLYLSSRYSFLPQQGLPDLVPLVILIVVMLVRNKPLPERGSLIRKALPAARPPKHVWQWTLILTASTVILALTLTGNYLIALITTLIGAFLAFSVVLLTGYVGQISLATYMFAGVAAFFMSRLTVEWGVPFPLAPIIAAGAAALVGAVIAIPAVRVRGINLAILTLALALTVDDMYFSNPKWVGAAGSPTEASPNVFGLHLGIALHKSYPRPDFALTVLVFVIPTVLLVVGIRRSSLGLQMLAVRANERAAAANGVNVFRVKLVGFGLAAFIAGLGGAFLGYMNYAGISESSFDVLGFMIPLLAIVMISGVSSVSGGVLAAIGIAGGLSAFLLQDLFNAVVWIPVVSSVGLMFAAVTIPEGIAGQLGDTTKVGSIPWLWDRVVLRGARGFRRRQGGIGEDSNLSAPNKGVAVAAVQGLPTNEDAASLAAELTTRFSSGEGVS